MPRYRGRLIFPFTAVIERLDTQQTRANVIGAASQGYDDDFREPEKIFDSNGDPVEARVDRTIRLQCQIEDDVFEAMRMAPPGDNPQTRLNLVFHFCDLERKGFVDKDGLAKIRNRDRLSEIRTCRGKLVQRFRNPPGAFAVHSKPAGFGLGLGRNLWIVTFEERELVPDQVR